MNTRLNMPGGLYVFGLFPFYLCIVFGNNKNRYHAGSCSQKFIESNVILLIIFSVKLRTFYNPDTILHLHTKLKSKISPWHIIWHTQDRYRVHSFSTI